VKAGSNHLQRRNAKASSAMTGNSLPVSSAKSVLAELGALLARAACFSANHPHKRKRRDRSPAPVILPDVGV